MSSKAAAEEREQKFLALWSNSSFDPLVKNDCAVKAGYSRSTAPAKSNKIIKALIQNQKMQRAMKKRGISFDKLAGKLDDLLDAKHPFAPDQPDNLAQHKALDTALKIQDAFPPAKLEIDKHERKEIVITGEVVQRLERFQEQRQRMERGETFDVIPATD